VDAAIRAAVEVALLFGIQSDDPKLVQETNHTVVWMRPAEVIAKVGTRYEAAENLSREFEVATCLFAQGSPVIRPLPGSSPTRHRDTSYFVTLWERVERDGDERISDLEVARSLQRVHADLAACNLSLPSFRITMGKARQTLFDDDQMRALPLVDREFLRRIFDRIRLRIDQFDVREQPLHGEPHEGNFISTATGIRWLDFENACVGPLEWDLAFLSDDVRKSFSSFDSDLLQALRALLDACITTWCGIQAHLPEMRAAGAEHSSSYVRSRTLTRDDGCPMTGTEAVVSRQLHKVVPSRQPQAEPIVRRNLL
jgi:hypothetical protein